MQHIAVFLLITIRLYQIILVSLTFKSENCELLQFSFLSTTLKRNNGVKTIKAYIVFEELRRKFPPRKDFHDKPDLRLSPETPYETRYFTVTLGENNNVISTNTGNIISVDEITAVSLAQQVADKTKGTLKQFRYLVSNTGNTKAVIFLDDTRNQNSFYNTLKSSILMAVIGITCVGILLFIFSDRAIAPIMKAIRNRNSS